MFERRAVSSVCLILLGCASSQHDTRSSAAAPPLRDNPHSLRMVETFEAAKTAAALPIVSLEARDNALQLTNDCQHELVELLSVWAGEGRRSYRAYHFANDMVDTSGGPMTLAAVGAACGELAATFKRQSIADGGALDHRLDQPSLRK